MSKLLVVLRGGDDGHPHGSPFGRLAYVLQDHAVGLLIEPLPVLGQLPVIGELVVVSEVEAELLFGGCDLALAQPGCYRN